MNMVHDALGSVAALWRYPVKSMLGEELGAGEFTAAGLSGDREYALVDVESGKIASAKNPRKWPHLFAFHAALSESPVAAGAPPAVRITLPDGTLVAGERRDIDAVLSRALERRVVMRSRGGRAALHNVVAEAYWPDMEGFDRRDTVSDFTLPENGFFDAAPVHVLTTATLERLHAAYPQGRFDPRRFRPNVVIDTPVAGDGFPENAWVGRTLALGPNVRLRITKPCARCVMTTLAQRDLPNDPGVLRAAAQRNGASVGVYATVLQAGTVKRGDTIAFA